MYAVCGNEDEDEANKIEACAKEKKRERELEKTAQKENEAQKTNTKQNNYFQPSRSYFYL